MIVDVLEEGRAWRQVPHLAVVVVPVAGLAEHLVGHVGPVGGAWGLGVGRAAAGVVGALVEIEGRCGDGEISWFFLCVRIVVDFLFWELGGGGAAYLQCYCSLEFLRSILGSDLWFLP